MKIFWFLISWNFIKFNWIWIYRCTIEMNLLIYYYFYNLWWNLTPLFDFWYYKLAYKQKGTSFISSWKYVNWIKGIFLSFNVEVFDFKFKVTRYWYGIFVSFNILTALRPEFEMESLVWKWTYKNNNYSFDNDHIIKNHVQFFD